MMSIWGKGEVHLYKCFDDDDDDDDDETQWIRMNKPLCVQYDRMSSVYILWLHIRWSPRKCLFRRTEEMDVILAFIHSFITGMAITVCRSFVPVLDEERQEGQHPLTGQRAANFRLLANQWAERRLVTQWRHGCRARRRSVCNAGASNAGRSLCVQIWRERSYPVPIYWYHSKGNWLRYNFAVRVFI